MDQNYKKKTKFFIELDQISDLILKSNPNQSYIYIYIFINKFMLLLLFRFIFFIILYTNNAIFYEYSWYEMN